MATTYHNDIQKLYVAYFNRPADVNGLAYWETVVEAQGGSTTAVSAAFAAEAEYEVEYADLTNAQIIAKVFQNLFGANNAGESYWVDILDAKKLTIDQIVTEVAGGAQGSDKVAYENKVKAAAAFTTALDTPAEIAGYDGEEANLLAKEFIASVTDDVSYAAATTPAALAAAVAAAVAAGTPFTLVAGLEALIAANESKADFLADAADVEAVADDLELTAVDADKPTAAEIETSIGNVEAAADTAIDLAIGDTYADESAAVRAAKLALLVATNKETLTDAQVDLAASTKEVKAMAGLTAAIAAFEAADAANENAIEAAGLAEVAVVTARSTFDVKNDDNLVDAGDDFTVDGDLVIVLNDDEEYELADGIDAGDYPGLAAFLTALNAQIAADAAEVAAGTALAIATKNVAYMDALETSEDLYKDVADAFVFNSVAIEDKASAAEVAAEVEAFATLIADLDAAADEANAGDTYADVVTALGVAVGGAPDVTAVKVVTAAALADGYITSADKAAIDAAATPAAAALLVPDNNWLARETVLTDAVADLDAAEVGLGLDPLSTQQAIDAGLVEGAQLVIDTLAEAVAAFNDAEEVADALAAENAAIEAALAAFEDNDFGTPITVGGTKFGTGADDVFIAGSADGTIKSFGLLGDDTLYIGKDFKLNAGDLEDGKNADLEVFIVEDGGDTVIYLETSTFGSNAADPEVITIILTGVAAEDVKLADGFITIV